MKELRLMLTREAPQEERTLGVLSTAMGEKLCETMEPGTDDRDFPRVPTGTYFLVPHDGTQYQDTYALVGTTVAHQETPGVDRFGILIHAGNRDDHTKGCILVGRRRGWLKGEPAVLDSRVALDALLERIDRHDVVILTIR